MPRMTRRPQSLSLQGAFAQVQRLRADTESWSEYQERSCAWILREGFRTSPQKQGIMLALAASDTWMSCEMIYDYVAEHHQSCRFTDPDDTASVMRQLMKLRPLMVERFQIAHRAGGWAYLYRLSPEGRQVMCVEGRRDDTA